MPEYTSKQKLIMIHQGAALGIIFENDREHNGALIESEVICNKIKEDGFAMLRMENDSVFVINTPSFMLLSIEAYNIFKHFSRQSSSLIQGG